MKLQTGSLGRDTCVRFKLPEASQVSNVFKVATILTRSWARQSSGAYEFAVSLRIWDNCCYSLNCGLQFRLLFAELWPPEIQNPKRAPNMPQRADWNRETSMV